MKKNTLTPPWAKRYEKPQQNREYDPFYGKERWKRVRKLEKLKHPLCAYCKPIISSTRVIDHVRPRRLFPELEWDTKNMVGSCSSCHNKKSAIESRITTREQYEMEMQRYIKICEDEHRV